MTNKQAILRTIEDMPENVSTEEVMYRLFVRERIARGLREIEKGKTVSHEQVRRSVARWLRSAGQ
jgi:predicted transcriptional regulator